MNLPVKYRPKNFEEITNQRHVVITLQNALKQQKISNAYLFAGPRGVGKTTTARIFAKGLNCEKGITSHPCGECGICREIDDGRSVDVLEIDGASNRGIDQIRELRENVRFTPVRARYKVIIIDEVHMLTTEAFNALLKTLEEPPPRVVFILATTEPRKVPDTVKSRTQRFDFRPLSSLDIKKRIKEIAEKEEISVESEEIFDIIAEAADGSLRDGIALLEQAYIFSGDVITVTHLKELVGLIGKEIYLKFFEYFKKGDKKAVVELLDELVMQGYSLEDFLRGFTEALDRLLRVKLGIEENGYESIAGRFTVYEIMLMLKIAKDMEESLKYSKNPRVFFDFHLLRLTSLMSEIDLNQVLARGNIYITSGANNMNFNNNHYRNNNQEMEDSLKKKIIEKLGLKEVNNGSF